MYGCTIRDEYGMVESGALCNTVSECAKWFEEHGLRFYANDDIKFKQYPTGNIIAEYTFCR